MFTIISLIGLLFSICMLVFIIVKKRTNLLVYVLGLIIISTVLLIVGVSKQRTTYTVTTTTTTNSVDTKKIDKSKDISNSQPSSEVKDALGSKKNPTPLGTPLTFTVDYNKTQVLEITLSNARRGEAVWNTIKDIPVNKYNDKSVPKDGMEWLLVDAKFKYKKGSEKLSLHNAYFSVFNGPTEVKQLNPNASPPGEFLNEDIFEGGEVTRTISLYVPIGSTEIVTEYRESFPKVYFKLT